MPTVYARVGQKLTIRLTITDEDGAAFDVSGASEKLIKLRGPNDAAAASKTATFYTDGTDGVVEYTTGSTDIDHSGAWRAQAQATISGGVYPSSIYSFTVEPNL